MIIEVDGEQIAVLLLNKRIRPSKSTSMQKRRQK